VRVRPPASAHSSAAARRLALEALHRIDDGAYANLVTPALLERSRLTSRDRNFVTAIAYGATRMRRALDYMVDRHALRPTDDEVRRVLRLGAFELAYLRTPPHAAVSQAVSLAPERARGFVNAVLRKVAADVAAGIRWPDLPTELSYPDWIFDALIDALGKEHAVAALRQMDEPAEATERDDGYIQDLASQWVVDLVGALPGERILELCAAPGGKSTLLAATGAAVTASDVSPRRSQLVAANAARLGAELAGVVAADGLASPFRPRSFDRVLVDAPCSGLGVLRRRPDARWRIKETDVEELADLQRRLLAAGAELVRPGGVLIYSVCTLTVEETLGVDLPALEALPAPGHPWQPWGRGARLLPQAEGTDGMYVLKLSVPHGPLPRGRAGRGLR
jgi:16S rRNA (cytosine967-C5)-methyltransferase